MALMFFPFFLYNIYNFSSVLSAVDIGIGPWQSSPSMVREQVIPNMYLTMFSQHAPSTCEQS